MDQVVKFAHICRLFVKPKERRENYFKNWNQTLLHDEYRVEPNCKTDSDNQMTVYFCKADTRKPGVECKHIWHNLGSIFLLQGHGPAESAAPAPSLHQNGDESQINRIQEKSCSQRQCLKHKQSQSDPTLVQNQFTFIFSPGFLAICCHILYVDAFVNMHLS